MPYQTTFVDDGRCVIITGSGVVLGSEILTAARAITEHVQGGKSLTRGWVDLSDVTELRVTRDDMHMIAAENRFAATLSPQIVVAVIASQDLAFGMARMWEAMMAMSNWQTHVFRDRQQAQTWLDMDADQRSSE